MEVRWTKPIQGWVKLNTDGSFAASEAAGAGMILRNSAGDIIFSACRALYSCRDALEAELCAVMEDLSASIQHTDSPIFVEMDSLEVISIINGSETNRSVYASLVNEIKYLTTHKHRGSQQFSRIEYSTQIYRFDTRGAKEYLKVLAAELSIQPHLETYYLHQSV